MSTTKGLWRWALAGAVVVAMASSASARLINDPRGISTVDPAGIVAYPKIVVDTDNGVDTIVQLTNTIDSMVGVWCFYVNANGHCSNAPTQVCTAANRAEVCPPGGLCLEGWQETDFRFNLTKRQPLSWSVNDGLPELPLNDTPGRGEPPQFNEGSIPPAPENPLVGELRCIQVDPDSGLPVARNDLKGEATIITSVEENDDPSDVDARKYAAVGLPSIAAQDGDPGTLNLGGPLAEYTGCPHVYTLNHFFEGANVETHAHTVIGEVRSELTVVPCAADFLLQDLNPASATIQFLIYNEFEQRFSTSTRVTCYRTVPLADIDTRPGPDGDPYSIFSVGVQGTLTGASRLRAVSGADVDGYDANGVLALLEESWASGICVPEAAGVAAAEYGDGLAQMLCRSSADCDTDEVCVGGIRSSTAAVNVQYQGARDQGDRMILPTSTLPAQ